MKPWLAVLLLAGCKADEPTAVVRSLAHPLFAVSSTDTIREYAKRDSAVRDSLALWAELVRTRKQPVATANRMLQFGATLLQPPTVVDTAVPPPPPDTTVPPPPPPSCSLLSDWSAHAEQPLSKPGYLQSVRDPVFGTTLTRITGDPGTPVGSGVSGSWGTRSRHYYSKDPAWSADGRLLVLKELGGALGPGVALFVDGTTYTPLFSRAGPSGGGEWRMHPSLPDIAVYVNSNGTVGHWNVRTNVSTKRVIPTGYSGASVGPDEGGLSYDGRWIAVNAQRSDGRQVAFVVDLQANTKGPDIDISGISIDWVSISALGGYVVLYESSQNTRIWRRDGTPLTPWTADDFGHYDLGVDVAGNEVAFGAASGGTYAKRFVARRLDTGTITPLSPPTSWNWHASTRNDLRRGWGYATTNDRTGAVVDGEIYALRLDGGAVERWAHHRSNNAAYWDAPHAVPSPDGKRILFASNWRGTTISTYIASCAP